MAEIQGRRHHLRFARIGVLVIILSHACTFSQAASPSPIDDPISLLMSSEIFLTSVFQVSTYEEWQQRYSDIVVAHQFLDRVEETIQVEYEGQIDLFIGDLTTASRLACALTFAPGALRQEFFDENTISAPNPEFGWRNASYTLKLLEIVRHPYFFQTILFMDQLLIAAKRAQEHRDSFSTFSSELHGTGVAVLPGSPTTPRDYLNEQGNMAFAEEFLDFRRTLETVLKKQPLINLELDSLIYDNTTHKISLDEFENSSVSRTSYLALRKLARALDREFRRSPADTRVMDDFDELVAYIKIARSLGNVSGYNLARYLYNDPTAKLTLKKPIDFWELCYFAALSKSRGTEYAAQFLEQLIRAKPATAAILREASLVDSLFAERYRSDDYRYVRVARYLATVFVEARSGEQERVIVESLAPLVHRILKVKNANFSAWTDSGISQILQTLSVATRTINSVTIGETRQILELAASLCERNRDSCQDGAISEAQLIHRKLFRNGMTDYSAYHIVKCLSFVDDTDVLVNLMADLKDLLGVHSHVSYVVLEYVLSSAQIYLKEPHYWSIVMYHYLEESIGTAAGIRHDLSRRLGDDDIGLDEWPSVLGSALWRHIVTADEDHRCGKLLLMELGSAVLDRRVGLEKAAERVRELSGFLVRKRLGESSQFALSQFVQISEIVDLELAAKLAPVFQYEIDSELLGQAVLDMAEYDHLPYYNLLVFRQYVGLQRPETVGDFRELVPLFVETVSLVTAAGIRVDLEEGGLELFRMLEYWSRVLQLTRRYEKESDNWQPGTDRRFINLFRRRPEVFFDANIGGDITLTDYLKGKRGWIEE